MSNRSSRSGKQASKKSTFTYYIPAPPHRKSGYREREFDKIMQGILKSGFEIEQLHTQAVGGSENGGLFIIAQLKAKSQKIMELDAALDMQEKFKLSDSPSSPDIILDEEDDL
jgi:hypothetical protein